MLPTLGRSSQCLCTFVQIFIKALSECKYMLFSALARRRKPRGGNANSDIHNSNNESCDSTRKCVG